MISIEKYNYNLVNSEEHIFVLYELNNHDIVDITQAFEKGKKIHSELGVYKLKDYEVGDDPKYDSLFTLKLECEPI